MRGSPQPLNNFCTHPENIFVVVGGTLGEEQILAIWRDSWEPIQSFGIDSFAQTNRLCPVSIGLPEANIQIALVRRRKSSGRAEDQVTFVGSDEWRAAVDRQELAKPELWNDPPRAPEDEYSVVLEDMLTLPESQRLTTRYLSLYAVPPPQRFHHVVVTSFVLNSLSWSNQIIIMPR